MKCIIVTIDSNTNSLIDKSMIKLNMITAIKFKGIPINMVI